MNKKNYFSHPQILLLRSWFFSILFFLITTNITPHLILLLTWRARPSSLEIICKEPNFLPRDSLLRPNMFMRRETRSFWNQAFRCWRKLCTELNDIERRHVSLERNIFVWASFKLDIWKTSKSPLFACKVELKLPYYDSEHFKPLEEIELKIHYGLVQLIYEQLSSRYVVCLRGPNYRKSVSSRK